MSFDPWRTLDLLPGIIIGLTVHEAAHAWVAHKLGDSTAQSQGRVSLSPFSHIDPVGLFFIIFAGFGWAKPVEFREERLRNPNRDPIYIALAGPVSNALLACVCAALYAFLFPHLQNAGPTGGSLAKMLQLAIFTNWGLFVFNLLPIPPLDGSHVVFWWLKRANGALYASLYKFGSWFLIILLVVTSQLGTGIPFLDTTVRKLALFSMYFFGNQS